ncbi:helix-turn-helix domain-containing protein [Pedobacter metabolipauper]|uniref:AraC-like DNA-binding protein n=1 Tax=Pedobacter metabolipauper TaxID=425513 RepID=A0A4R6SSU9_9SPHI|nr:AraC family transcriptional regulator [Pedobacter metabolipauper]TDQ08058.1 AraC-like DNA-binding protein [Pedobacter metabolipauper]
MEFYDLLIIVGVFTFFITAIFLFKKRKYSDHVNQKGIENDATLSPETLVREVPFSKELIVEYTTRLDEYVSTYEPFKIQGLTISDLARQLDMPLYHLSYLLNHSYNKRFSDFINDHRIDFIKRRLKSENWKEYTFEGLATEAGFTSRSNFFNAFKKCTGLSPSEYLRQQQ